MFAFRLVWWVLAVAAVGLAAWAGGSPVSGMSLSCSKTGVFDDGQTSVQCDDSMVQVFGVWPLVLLGLLLVIPPVMAAMAMRWWVSWLVVAAFVGLLFVGLLNWTSFWGLLLIAVPLAVVGFLVAVVQLIAHLVDARPKHRTAPVAR